MRLDVRSTSPSLFSTSSLHTSEDDERLERLLGVERAYTEFNSRRALRPDEGRLQWRAMGGHTVAVRDGARPEVAYYNRVLGLSRDTLAGVDEIVAWHREIGAPTQLDLAPSMLAPDVLEPLQERGFRHAGLVSLLCGDPRALARRPPVAVARSSAGVHIEAVDASNVDAFFDHIESTAPTLPPIRPSLRALRRDHFVTPDFQVFLASIDGLCDGAAAASAALFVHDGVAVLANATTLRAARGRGCQRALLAHRLDVAAELGCDLVVAEVLWGTAQERHLLAQGLEAAWNVAWWLRDDTI